MTMQLTKTENSHNADVGEIVERVMLVGDLAKLKPEDRVNYYNTTCQSLGLNPLTRPFEYITLNGKLQLYARKDATDQLRRIYGISVRITARERVGDCWVVTANASTPQGRTDESVGAVSVGKATGDALANMLMKAETKAKRRVTLSICGLGMMDETELETITDAKPHVDPTPAANHDSYDAEPVVDERQQIISGIVDALKLKYKGDQEPAKAAIQKAFGCSFKHVSTLEIDALRDGAAKLYKIMNPE